ncbi:MAG: cell envelope integrity protein TolA [Bacteroidaceae bacterium]|nr:cell envelope integrity protein TolA [Bacteroidaceae bacterium]
MQKEKDEYRKRVEEEERRRKEEERKRLEAERKAEEERIRKIKEAEEAKRRAEEERIRKEKEAAEEAIRKAKKAEEDRIRKAKEAEEAKRRAEEDAKRKAKADEEAKRRAEEAQKRETELCNKYLAELKNIEKDYNSLHAKWEKYGAAEMKSLSKEWGSPVEYGKDFLNVAANRQWWQYPFYVQGEWTVSKLQVKNKEVFEILKKKEEIIDCTSNKLKKLFDTNGIELKSKASRNEISRNEEIAQAIRRNCYRLY